MTHTRVHRTAIILRDDTSGAEATAKATPNKHRTFYELTLTTADGTRTITITRTLLLQVLSNPNTRIVGRAF